MRLVALVAPVLVAAYLPRPVTEVVPDAASCVAVAGAAVDDEWCRTSCGATTPSCPAAVCVCGDEAKEAKAGAAAVVPAVATGPSGELPAGVGEEPAAQAPAGLPGVPEPEATAPAPSAPTTIPGQELEVPAAHTAKKAKHGAARADPPELLGYLENWNDVKWWDNGIPHNCLQGCFEPKALLNYTAPFSAVNYGFIFFTNEPSPDQNGCKATKKGSKEDHNGKTPFFKSPEEACPIWDGKALYMSKASKKGSHAIDAQTTLENMTAGLVSIAEAVRLGRMHPLGPKRTKIALGGWSDYARLGSLENAKAAAALAAKAVLYTFADGIDVDLEHLADQASVPADLNPFEALAAFMKALRKELDGVSSKWVATANKRKGALRKQLAEMDDWSQEAFGPFIKTSLQYLDEVAANGPPHLEISWTTRFNAFVPAKDPFNYVKQWTGEHPDRKEAFGSDNEGAQLWPHVADVIDTVNIMAYDAANMTFDHAKVLENFVTQQVPAEKINLGFEPGEQAAGGKWQGKAVDKAAAKLVKEGGFGGCMIWGANPDPVSQPLGRKHCPEVAAEFAEILKPSFRFGRAPTYTKVERNTGWLPSIAKDVWPPPVPSKDRERHSEVNARQTSGQQQADQAPARSSQRRPGRSMAFWLM